MKNKTSIQIKAAFLLVVFALNTLVGLACSIGIDMKFNSSHHDQDEVAVPVVHIHADGKNHVHKEVTGKHDHGNGHHHDEQAANNKSKDGKDNCCNDKVVKLDQLDKSLAKTIDCNHFVFFTTFISVFHYTDLLYNFQFTSKVKHFVRNHHPPIPDIRIAIQSFQI